MHYRSHQRRPGDARISRRPHHHASNHLAKRLRSFDADQTQWLFAPDARRAGFVTAWFDALDPLLRTWLLTSLRREAVQRASDELADDPESSAIELLMESCAEAHGLAVLELRWLVPEIEEECRAFVREHLELRRRA
jgi:hypothetical protein